MMLDMFTKKEMKMKAQVMLFTRDNDRCSTSLPGQYPTKTDLAGSLLIDDSKLPKDCNYQLILGKTKNDKELQIITKNDKE